MADEAPTGDRPPSILGPYGEGYCRVCKFIEPLDPAGLIEAHSRGQMISPHECKGSGGRPAKVTPRESRLVAFKTKSEKVQCPVCKRTVNLLNDGRMTQHTPQYSVTSPCKGSYNFPTFRDYGNERGAAA